MGGLWRRVEKMNLYAYTAVLQAFVVYLMESGVEPSEIASTLKDFGKRIGEQVSEEFLSLETVIPRTERELEVLLNDLLDYVVGQSFDQITVEKTEKGMRAICRVRNCRLCLDLESPSPEIKMCNILAGVMEHIVSRVSENLGVKSVSCQETRCRAAGAESCEFVLEMET